MGNVKPVISETTDLMLGRQGSVAKARTQVLQRVRYRAVWRAGWLVICPVDCHPFRQSVSAVMEGDRDRLLACLKRSPVKRLLLSPELSVAELQFWAELGLKVGRNTYVRGGAIASLRYQKSLFLFWNLSYAIRSVLLGLLTSPLYLIIALILSVKTGKIFSHKWSINSTGKLFPRIIFNTNLISNPARELSIYQAFWSRLEYLIEFLDSAHGATLLPYQDLSSCKLKSRELIASSRY